MNSEPSRLLKNDIPYATRKPAAAGIVIFQRLNGTIPLSGIVP
jgi:hypothetical protein